MGELAVAVGQRREQQDVLRVADELVVVGVLPGGKVRRLEEGDVVGSGVVGASGDADRGEGDAHADLEIRGLLDAGRGHGVDDEGVPFLVLWEVEDGVGDLLDGALDGDGGADAEDGVLCAVGGRPDERVVAGALD